MGLIPARGGSKGIPRKNLRDVGGRPLIEHTFRAAACSRLLDRVILSTDSPEIAELGRKNGIETPFIRPAELATDTATLADVAIHAIQWMRENENWIPEYIVLLQPTSPLRTSRDVDGCIELALSRGADAVISVAPCGTHPCLARTVDAGGVLKPLFDGPLSRARRQDLPSAFMPNGAVYVVKTRIMEEQRIWYPDGALAYVMPEERSFDVDTELELRIVENMMQSRAPQATAAAAGSRPAVERIPDIESPMPEIEINGKRIGGKNPCYIIAEAGVNHNGDPDLAMRLVDAAAEAGADAVKFQSFTAERLVTPGAARARYQEESGPARESQLQMLRRLELTPADFRRIMRHCEKRGIEFLSTPFDVEWAGILDRLGVRAFKIASGELTDLRFIAEVASKGKPVILSTGMACMEEVREAVKTARNAGLRDLVILHCTSAYPADPAMVNLKAMLLLRGTLGVWTGLSDHTQGIGVPVGAAALGAAVIEKHFTLDKRMNGPDHAMSLDPDELRALVRGIRDFEKAMGGTGRKMPCAAEQEIITVARKSLFAATDMRAGTVVRTRDLAALRPGTGISPARIGGIVGHRTARAVKKGEMLEMDMFQA